MTNDNTHQYLLFHNQVPKKKKEKEETPKKGGDVLTCFKSWFVHYTTVVRAFVSLAWSIIIMWIVKN